MGVGAGPAQPAGIARVLRENDEETATRTFASGCTGGCEDLLAWRPIELDAWMLAPAWGMEDRFGLPHWDSLIVAAASVAGCELLLSEDLQQGADLDDLRVVDPFQTSVGEI